MDRRAGFKTILPFVLLLFVAGCGRQYAKGGYISPNEIILRSDKFVEADLQQIAKKLTESLLKDEGLSNGPHQPKVVMSLITNSTDEHIDMKSLSDKIRTVLIKSKKFQFINENLRSSADYGISGNISTIKQPVGRQEIVYYKATLEMTNLSTNIIAWTDEVELKKKFRKRFTGF